MSDDPEQGPDPTVGDWAPRVGGRVTLDYPDMGRNFPRQRVGTVMKVEEGGAFHVCVQPSQHLVFVDPANYRDHGATYRCWNVRDGWPFERRPAPKKDRKR